MKCIPCNSTGVIIENCKISPCNKCSLGWQKLCFGLQYEPKSKDLLQTDIEDFIASREPALEPPFAN